MFHLLLSSAYAVDTLEPIVKWLTIALAIAVFVPCIILFFIRKEWCGKVIKTAVFCFVVYALLIGVTMLILEITKHYNQGYLEDNWVNKDIIPFVFVPAIVTLSVFLIGAVTLFILSKKNPKAIKLTAIILGVIAGACLVTTMVLIAIYYGKHIADDGYYSNSLNGNALYISAGGLVALLIVGAILLGLKDKKSFDTRCIAFAGVAVALSFALSFIKLFEMPQGGSITLVSMLPIMLFSYVYGAKKGVLVGFLYGLLQAVQDPFIIHPAQFLLDYPIAFALTGFAGSLTHFKVLDKLPQVKFAIGAVIGSALRFFAHVLSGVFAFGAYATDLGVTNFWAYSTAYNSFVFIDIILVIVVGVILFSSKAFNREMNKFKTL